MLDRIKNAFEILKKGGEVKTAIKEVQRALISSDVDVKLVLEMTRKVEEKIKKLPPTIPKRDAAMREIYKELLKILGGKKREFPLSKRRIMLVGLYGSGKTTSAVKLGNYLKKKGLSVLLICADVHRPAAYEQMSQLADKSGVRVFGDPKETNPEKIIKSALKVPADVYILDTAGRSSVDNDLVEELERIKSAFDPDFIILVLPADIGQVAGREAGVFSEKIGLDGIIITKMDGSGKGGGALSACAKEEIPVFFIGTGEKINDFEEFDPERFISRILGAPDISFFVERVEKKEIPEKFDVNTFYDQIRSLREMGSVDRILAAMGLKSVPSDVKRIATEKFKKYDAIYKSMTNYERKNPECLNRSRIERIARGSGTTEEDVRAFIKDFRRVEKMFRKIKKREKYLEKLLKKGKLPVIR